MKVGPRRGGRVGSVVSKSDVQRLQRDITSDVGVLDAVVLACLGKLAQATIDQWHTMKNRALSFAGETAPTFFTASAMDAGQAIQTDLAGWHTRLSSEGCANVPAAPTVAPPAAPLFSFLGELPPVLLVVGLFLLARQLKT